MEYTEQQKADFRQQFRVRRQRQLILAIPLIALFVVFTVLSDEMRSGTVAGLPVSAAVPAFLILVAGAVVFSFQNWRCPACGRYLGKGLNPRFCQKCGAPLQ